MKTVNILGHKFNPNCNMDEFQEQGRKFGLGEGTATIGYSGLSNLSYGNYWSNNGKYHVCGDYYGKRVLFIEFSRALKWGMEKRTVWKKHFWSDWF